SCAAPCPPGTARTSIRRTPCAAEAAAGASRAQHRALSALVIGEVALSLVLLIGASLVLRGFSTLVNRDPGFDPRPVLTLTATVSPQRYGDSGATRGFLRP